jgi:GH25 family lysozyme M1 (1,4-beta-N-acetylmuramidase)
MTSLVIDPVGVDLYAYDVNGNPDVAALIAAGLPWSFIALKAAEGTYYDAGAWLKTQWLAARQTDRYGDTWFRLAYTYLIASLDGVAQADYFLGCVERAGGFTAQDIVPVLDFETAEQPAGVTAAQVEDCLSACAARIKSVLGVAPMRYTGSLFRDLGIVGQFGCPWLWVADYEPELEPQVYTDQGYTLADTWGYQYRGTSPQSAGPKGYPMTAPVGPGGADVPVDTTAIIINGGGTAAAQLPWTKANLLIGSVSGST